MLPLKGDHPARSVRPQPSDPQQSYADGGFEKFRNLGLEDSTIATWLDDAGYDTMLIGKYFNGYDNTTYVPQGWDEWHGYLGDYVQSDTYRINENGQIKTYFRSQIHDTDLFADKAATFR